MPLLELRNVSAGYGGAPDILDGIGVDVEAGRTYCIIGPNGAGKSTLLKTIAGLLRPRTGEITFDGRAIHQLRPDQVLARGLCYVPQDRALFPNMTVRENLTMGAFLERDRRVVDERMRQAFDLFPMLAERASQRAGTLSGGEQQMVVLARALMLSPRLLMIDEPSLGLAPMMADQIFATIRGFSEMDIAVLLVEQNVERGLGASEWAFVLDLGVKRFEGPAGEILGDPRIRELYLGRKASDRGGNPR